MLRGMDDSKWMTNTQASEAIGLRWPHMANALTRAGVCPEYIDGVRYWPRDQVEAWTPFKMPPHRYKTDEDGFLVLAKDTLPADSRAVCAGMDPEIWFPETPANMPPTQEAIRLCNACPIREACLEDALRVEEGRKVEHRFGIWGGKTPLQRLALDARRLRAANA